MNTTACKRLFSLGCVPHTDGAVFQTVPEGGAEWGREMVDAWATALADELDVRCGRASAEEVRQRRVAVEAVAPVSGGSAKL